MLELKILENQLKNLANKTHAMHAQGFFKTGKGEYGEGDIFIGIRVSVLRKLAKEYFELKLIDVEKLLQSEIHEKRLLALFILVAKFNKTDEAGRKEIYNLYIKNRKFVNNWDLVDCSALYIAGNYLFDKDKSILYKYAGSKFLWEKRIAILSCFYFIKFNDFKDALNISEILVNDDHDLIHKAVGWMLREIGNRDLQSEENFLKKYYKTMPRTMLRYAIEKFPETLRKKYLHGQI